MATQRTAEEKLAIVEHCMDLEREGGDIQAYLYSEHYYTPRATWHNIQREYLHRKPYERTDGKPTKKGDGNMVILTDDQRMEAVTLAIEGKNPKTYLEGLGCPDPEQTWYRIRQWCKDKRPDAFEKLPTKGKRYEKPKAEETPAVKIDGQIRIETPEANKVEIVEKPEKPKITQPVQYEKFTVREVEGLFGRYRRSDVNEKIYIDFELTEGADIMSYTFEQWQSFRKEQERAFMILGVEL